MNKTTKTEPRYLKSSDAAAYLGVGHRFLKELVDRQEIRAAKVGTRTILFARSDLDALFERNAETRAG